MTCLKPITAWKKRIADLTQNPWDYYKDKKLRFKDPKNDKIWEKVQIACGHCLGCALDKSNTWATRIATEIKNHKENCFITITYNNENLPINENGKMTLRKKDFQDFLKRLRYHINKKILYFGCGEYGNTTYRPHGHFIIMGWKPQDLKLHSTSKSDKEIYTSEQLQKIWGMGFISVQEANYKTACYVARYVQKKAGLKPNKRHYTNELTFDTKIDERTGEKFLTTHTKYQTETKDMLGREKEFILMSKKPAIGKTYLEQNKNKVIHNKGILLKVADNVVLKPIPRYFKKLLEKDNWEQHDKLQYKIKTEAEKNLKKQLNEIKSYNPKLTLEETQKINLEARAKYLKRNQI